MSSELVKKIEAICRNVLHQEMRSIFQREVGALMTSMIPAQVRRTLSEELSGGLRGRSFTRRGKVVGAKEQAYFKRKLTKCVKCKAQKTRARNAGGEPECRKCKSKG